MDSPAMKSVSQKTDMFEQQGTPEVELPDPVLMSMSQRKAMVEKDKVSPHSHIQVWRISHPSNAPESQTSDQPGLSGVRR